MRVSTSYIYQFSSTSIQNAQQNEVKLQQELSTGKRINQPSDDPSGMAQSLTLTALNNTLAQYNSNLTYAKQFLSESDNALSSVSGMASQAYQLAVQAANSTTSQDARQGMVNQVAQMQQQLVSLANSQGANGEYIFAGQKTQAPPFAVASNALTYTGDTNNINVETGPGQTMAVNTQAGTMFTSLYNQLETFKNDLSSGNVSALSNVDIANLQSSQTAVVQARGAIGSNLQQVSTLTNANTLRTNDLTAQISNLTDANIAQVATQYQSAATVYQAAITMAAQASTMSLASYLQTSATG
ncbi:MAG: flagellar hook-associated protein FlgL [Fimbriimonadaceae bacterium]